MPKVIIIGTFAIALALLASCGGGPAETKQTQPPAKSYTAKQIEAALPTLSDVPGAAKISLRCPGDDACIKPDDGSSSSLSFELGGEEFAAIKVDRHSGAIAAERSFAKKRDKGEKYVGSFETKAEAVDARTYNPGLKGTGTLTETTVNGWSGYATARSMIFISPKGIKSDKTQDGGVTVRKGNVIVSAHSAVEDRSDDQASVKLSRQVVKDYLDRLR